MYVMILLPYLACGGRRGGGSQGVEEQEIGEGFLLIKTGRGGTRGWVLWYEEHFTGSLSHRGTITKLSKARGTLQDLRAFGDLCRKPKSNENS